MLDAGSTSALDLKPMQEEDSRAIEGRNDCNLKPSSSIATSKAAELDGMGEPPSQSATSCEAQSLLNGRIDEVSGDSRTEDATTRHEVAISGGLSAIANENASSDDEWGEETWPTTKRHDDSELISADGDHWGEVVPAAVASLHDEPTPLTYEAVVSTSDALLRSHTDKFLQKESVQQNVPIGSDDWDYGDKELEEASTGNSTDQVRQAPKDLNNIHQEDSDDDWGEEISTQSNFEDAGRKMVVNDDEDDDGIDEWSEEIPAPENGSLFAEEIEQDGITPQADDIRGADATASLLLGDATRVGPAATAVPKLEVTVDSTSNLAHVQEPLAVDALLRSRSDKYLQKEFVQQIISNDTDDWDYDDESEDTEDGKSQLEQVTSINDERNRSHNGRESDDDQGGSADDWGEEVTTNSIFEDPGSKIVENDVENDDEDEWGEEISEPLNGSVLSEGGGLGDWDIPADNSDGSDDDDAADANLLAVTQTIQIDNLRRARLGNYDDGAVGSNSGGYTHNGETSNVHYASEDEFVDYIAPSADSVLNQSSTRDNARSEGGDSSTTSAAAAYYNHRKHAVAEAYCALHHMNRSSLPHPTTPDVVRVLIGDGPLGLSVLLADGRLMVSEVRHMYACTLCFYLFGSRLITAIRLQLHDTYSFHII